jgi:hypothetical protein
VLKSTGRPPEEIACHTKSVAPWPLAHPTKAYLPECVEGKFSDLRPNGVLRRWDEKADPPYAVPF